MRLPRDMHRDRQSVIDIVKACLGEDIVVAVTRRREAAHLAPEKAGCAPLARAVHRVRQAKALFVESACPFLGIIVHADAFFRGRQKIDMVAQREPGAAERCAGFGENIGQCTFARDRQHVGRESQRGVERLHSDP